jgi:hypothetical protein
MISRAFAFDAGSRPGTCWPAQGSQANGGNRNLRTPGMACRPDPQDSRASSTRNRRCAAAPEQRVSDTRATPTVVWFAPRSASRSLSSPPILGKSLRASNLFFSPKFSAVISAITTRIRSICHQRAGHNKHKNGCQGSGATAPINYALRSKVTRVAASFSTETRTSSTRSLPLLDNLSLSASADTLSGNHVFTAFRR